MVNVNDIKSVISGHAHPNTIYHALYAYFFLHYTAAFIAKVFGKTRQCISNWIHKYGHDGSVGRSKTSNRTRKFSTEQRLWIYDYFMKHPASYLREAKKAFKDYWKTFIGASTIWSMLQNEFNLTWKKLERRARHVRLVLPGSALQLLCNASALPGP